jgi:ribose 5-phosphate isomerase A
VDRNGEERARNLPAVERCARVRGEASMTDHGLESAAASALELITDGMRIGLGSGRAAGVFLSRLADRIRSGLRVVGVPTSEATAAQARSLGIPLGTLDDDEQPLALTVDGADEVAPNLDLVKGFGGALVRERIVAAASYRQVIVVGHEKLVDRLGTRGRIPLEVVPFACGPVLRRVRALGIEPVVRRPFVSDNGNLAVDCGIATPLADARAARALEADLRAIPGVVDTGLFLGTAERVLVGYADGHVDVLQAAR